MLISGKPYFYCFRKHINRPEVKGFLRELKQSALVENAEREGKRQRITEMAKFLDEQPEELEEYDEQLVRRLIEKVTVFDDKVIIEFKSGVEILVNNIL